MQSSLQKPVLALVIERSSQLKHEYDDLRIGYIGLMFTDEYLFDVLLVDSVVRQLKLGKAPGLNNLIAEHFIHSHPALISILVKLFNIMISCGSVPTSFGRSYTVPVPKGRQASSTVDDFRVFL